NDARGCGVAPGVLGVGIDPDKFLVLLRKTLHPDIAGFFVPVLDAAARLGDLIGRHGCVADENYLPVRAVLMQQIHGWSALGGAAEVVLPDGFINEIVEVEVLKMLELGLAG